MEIFNAIRAQHSQPTTQTQDDVAGANRTQQAQKSGIQEGAQKQDTEKLKRELQEVVDKLNKEMDPLKTSIRFGFNDQVNELYVSVIDTTNNEEIRQIPSEEAMRLAAKMRELVGMIFDKKG
ncbi:MAG: flagellar biosynthesis protein FlaG [Epsilonproteobacteria bacterium]|nr:flagellar biosynthesis protein FlaG [Campylobacterota bacterium]